jgi:hypothetical protein
MHRPSAPAALLLAACAGPPDAARETGAPAALPDTCNGHLALCDRPLDQVTLPGTHNSMSNDDAGWGFPNQQHGLTRQLDDGVRALMLDTHRTDDGLMLCHSYCELGQQPLGEGLGEISAFLDANRGEVVVLIFQDAITVEETVGALDDAGLADLAYTWDPTADAMPTLRQLIDADTRLVVSAEFSGPPPAWYHHAWDLIVDTPYSFESADQFTCAQNRGAPDNPLLLVNHWLSTPLPTRAGAAEVNRADVLGARADACAAEWDRPVNLLAVDFYEQGDLFDVVDRLNGVGAWSEGSADR